MKLAPVHFLFKRYFYFNLKLPSVFIIGIPLDFGFDFIIIKNK